MISIAMWLASMLTVDLKTTEQDRRAEALRFADTFRHVMESAVILPENERKPMPGTQPVTKRDAAPAKGPG